MIDITQYSRPSPPRAPPSLQPNAHSPLECPISGSTHRSMPTPTPSPSRSVKRDHETMVDESTSGNQQQQQPFSAGRTPHQVNQDMNDIGAQLLVDVLGDMFKSLKIDVWHKLLLQQNKSANEIPSVPLLAVDNFLYQVQDNSNVASDYIAADIYCSMTGFMAIYLGLIELLFHDLVTSEMDLHSSMQQLDQNPFDSYMGLFACGDDVASSSDDLFTWYHWQNRTHLVTDLKQRLALVGLQQFRSLALIDTVLTRFYTTHLLQPVAQQHQKDHGQFYTPQCVVRFMWSLCLNNKTKPDSGTDTIGDSAGGFDHGLAQSPPILPRVFDPCMGIGAFLCEYLTRLISRTKAQDVLWNDGEALKFILSQLPDSIWGVEIDPFAFKLGKLNIMVHMFPLYQRCLLLGTRFEPLSIGRLSLFRNDTLRLDLDANPYTTKDKTWEQQQLLRLRDPSKLVFDYVVTNPPYMIRKTGFVTNPDKSLYDEKYLGGKGTQAYMYFMWFCLQRCHPVTGQLCFITPSQWTVLEFAGNLRKWIWENCQLQDLLQFEPFKVWPKVQTDSLIFRLCKRQQLDHLDSTLTTNLQQHHYSNQQVLFLRHLSRKASLEEILEAYRQFDCRQPETQDPLIKYKITPTNDVDLFHTTMHGSFAYLSPTSAVSDLLMNLTRSYPRLCDDGSQAPLIWHRGPNTNPVYALVVRTKWAMDAFGKECCDQWLRPVFYWNGKSSTPTRSSTTRGAEEDPATINSPAATMDTTVISPLQSSTSSSSSSSSSSISTPPPVTSKSTTNCKEILFWSDRDPLRLTKKENSPAEAYVPFDGRSDTGDGLSHYSMILVDRYDTPLLDKSSALYQYLHEARLNLQPGQTDKELAWCHYNKCGVDLPVKLVHPINFGYFSRTQPRQRFFIDRQQRCVTNQCMYFTIKQQQQYNMIKDDRAPDISLLLSALPSPTTSSSILSTPSSPSPMPLPPSPWENYYLGILNSSIVQFFIRAHCYYDQQGRTRFFAKNMAKIPHAPPTPIQLDKMNQYVEQLTEARTLIYDIIRFVDSTPDKQPLRSVMDKVRNCIWDLAPADRQLLEQVSPHYFATMPTMGIKAKLKQGGGDLADQMIRLLIVQSLLQYAVDHLAYKVYGIPSDLQLQLEQELGLYLTLQWQIYQHHLVGCSILDLVERILIGNLVIE